MVTKYVFDSCPSFLLTSFVSRRVGTVELLPRSDTPDRETRIKVWYNTFLPTQSPLPPGAGQLEKREGIAQAASLTLLLSSPLAPGGRGATQFLVRVNPSSAQLPCLNCLPR